MTLTVVTLALAGAAMTELEAGPPVAALTRSANTPVGDVPEYNAKAGYLLLFCRYVEWPSAAFAGSGAPIVIGVLGSNPFGDVLTRTVSGQQHNGREIVVSFVESVEEARRCQVVFIPRGSGRQQELWLEALRHSPVLTVVETSDGLENGAVVAFTMEGGARGARLKFDASVRAAEQAGIRISATMLSAARMVIRGAPKGGGR